MTITYDGTAHLDPFAQAILYDVRVDGVVVHCSFAKDTLAFCIDDSGDPLDTFNSCHLLILAYTKYSLLKHGMRVDGQYKLGLDEANSYLLPSDLAVLNVEPRCEDDAAFLVDATRQGNERSRSLTSQLEKENELYA